jgi:hypothetical protein
MLLWESPPLNHLADQNTGSLIGEICNCNYWRCMGKNSGKNKKEPLLLNYSGLVNISSLIIKHFEPWLSFWLLTFIEA